MVAVLTAILIRNSIAHTALQLCEYVCENDFKCSLCILNTNHPKKNETKNYAVKIKIHKMNEVNS